MTLRMLGEKIYGNTPGVMPGAGRQMLQMQMLTEDGTHGAMLNIVHDLGA